MLGPSVMIVRTPRHHTSAAIGGMPAESCLLAAASDLWSTTIFRVPVGSWSIGVVVLGGNLANRAPYGNTPRPSATPRDKTLVVTHFEISGLDCRGLYGPRFFGSLSAASISATMSSIDHSRAEMPAAIAGVILSVLWM